MEVLGAASASRGRFLFPSAGSSAGKQELTNLKSFTAEQCDKFNYRSASRNALPVMRSTFTSHSFASALCLAENFQITLYAIS